MKIIFAKTIAKKEGLKSIEKVWLIKSYSKGIFQVIKGEALPIGASLVKLYMTTIAGARRAVFMRDVKTNDGFFLMFRSKNDSIGVNISIKNPKFRETLRKYLLLLKEDIKESRLEVFEA